MCFLLHTSLLTNGILEFEGYKTNFEGELKDDVGKLGNIADQKFQAALKRQPKLDDSVAKKHTIQLLDQNLEDAIETIENKYADCRAKKESDDANYFFSLLKVLKMFPKSSTIWNSSESFQQTCFYSLLLDQLLIQSEKFHTNRFLLTF